MVVEFSPQAITFLMYVLALVIGVFVRTPAIAMLCGIAGVAIGLYMIAIVGFWLGILMTLISACVAVLGTLPLFK